ncbi:hypothetical protein [Nonomuraea sp. NPDC049028]|uniref:hypothetical protein n=1 Tax=Nonomuraea sp. NPDC049028 TaxID=3364348 RepID=UPI0037148278
MMIRNVTASALLTAALFGALPGAAATPAPAAAAAAECGVRSDGKLYCGNTPNVTLSYDASYQTAETGVLTSSFSWFQCWVEGGPHAGGNSIWYLAAGDKAVPPYRGWGFLPAVHVATDHDPAPGLRECTLADYDLIGP